MPYADNDGVELAYERAGAAEGDTVVFVEGLGYGRWMWGWQREALAGAHDLLLWDNRGTGASEEPEGPYTISQMAGDLEAVLADAGVDAAHVVGASMGGMIAQQYALDYDRAVTVTLCCTTPGGEEALPVPAATRERMFDVPEGLDRRGTIRYKMKPAFTDEFWADHGDTIEDIVAARLETDASERAYAWQSEAVDAFDVHDRLSAVDVPALLMHGTRDRVVPVDNHELIAAELADVEVELFDEGGSHLFFIERAGAVNDRLRAFLEDHGRGA